MVVVMAQDAAPQDIDAVVELVRGAGGEAFVSRGVSRTIVGLVGDIEQFHALNLGSLRSVRDVVLLSRAAIAVGTDGIIVDVHPHPETALCDGPQALVGGDIRELASIAQHLAPIVGRTLTPAPELAPTG